MGTNLRNWILLRGTSKLNNMNSMTIITMQLSALAFAIFALAEFWSKISEIRKTGYIAAAILVVVIIAMAAIENIGSIIYRVPQ